MRCLVTGGSGHLGSYLTRVLLQKGHVVGILARPTADLGRLADVLPQVRVVRGDLAAIDQVKDDLLELAPEIVFHLAWAGVVNQGLPYWAQLRANVEGSLRLLEITMEAGSRTWVGVGSQAEYGPYPEPLREDMAAKPVTAYGVAKLCVGLLSRHACVVAGVRWLWLRLLATYGPKDDPRHLIPSVALNLLAGRRPALTFGEQRWDYLYVSDAAEAIHELAMNSTASGLFNLASGETYRIRDIVERLRDLIQPDLALVFGEVPYDPGQIMRLESDVTRLREATGWRPKVSLDEGLGNRGLVPSNRLFQGTLSPRRRAGGPSTMKASNYIAAFLAAQGVTHVFEVVGGMIAHLIDSIARRGGIRLVSTHHEQAAAFGAEAMARLTGVPGVAMATSGPGATNLLTGIGSCYFDSSPAVFITGQVNRNEQKGTRAIRQLGFQETDIVAMAQPITKAALSCRAPEDLPQLLMRAFELALSGRPGPVLIDIPMDVQRANLSVEPPQRVLVIDGVRPEPREVDELLVALLAAQRPLILAGGVCARLERALSSGSS